ncbi:MAG: hypothetical protein M0P11_09755 [Anaerolineaceae bacterium]|nr:hypothetical protein [Anaerolineaceae bacterium]
MNNVAIVPAHEILDQVKQQFEAWRKQSGRTRKIPEELWEAAVALCKEHSVTKVSKALGLNHSDLKQRMKSLACLPQTPTFIELGCMPPAAEEIVVECEAPGGRSMRIHYRGSHTAAMLSDLLSRFWRDGQ